MRTARTPAIDQEDVRFVVANDMKASERTPLKMDWAQFVWLALALGISAYDPTWQSSYPCTFKNDKNEDLVHLSYEEDWLFAKFALREKLTYSLQRAFAWYNIKLDGDRLLPLGYCEAGHVCLNSVTISPELSACRLGMNLGSKGYSSTIHGREPQDCNNPLAAACCWMMYWRLQYGEFREILPVSQQLLEYRQRVLCHLNSLDDNKMLATKVRSLVLAKYIDEIATQLEPNLHGASNTTQTSEPTLPHLDPSQSIPRKTEVTESKQPVEDAPLNAHHQSQVEAILWLLRSRLAASKYVQIHFELCKLVEYIKTELLVKAALEKREPSRSKASQMSSIFLGRKRDRIPDESLERLKTLWSPFEPQAGKSAKNRSESDFYNLLPSNLKAEFESNVQSWASDPDVQGGSRWDEMEGTGFLACVALALTDWDCYETKAWQPCDDLAITVDQIDRLIKDLRRAGSLKEFWEVNDADKLERLLGHCSTGVLEKGLFTAPSESPVSRLFQLREKEPMVYLI
jgi:hypothetical protein